MVYVTIRIDWQLALVALAASPALLLVAQAYRPRLRSQSREVRRLESAALGVVHEVLGALRVVKAFGQEERSEEHTSELQSPCNLVCRLLLEKKNILSDI